MQTRGGLTASIRLFVRGRDRVDGPTPGLGAGGNRWEKSTARRKVAVDPIDKSRVRETIRNASS